jgi:hypothetical protein
LKGGFGHILWLGVVEFLEIIGEILIYWADYVEARRRVLTISESGKRYDGLGGKPRSLVVNACLEIRNGQGLADLVRGECVFFYFFDHGKGRHGSKKTTLIE